MKSFSKLVESIESEKYFKSQCEVDLIFKAENAGEAGYMTDSELGSIPSHSDFRVLDIQEITKEEFESMKLTESVDEDGQSIKDKIREEWFNQFGDRNPNQTEKAEFYHQMRNKGYDGYVVFDALSDKMPIK
jgi:hypothetical protein